jgi:hypothetical protein
MLIDHASIRGRGKIVAIDTFLSCLLQNWTVDSIVSIIPENLTAPAFQE